MDNKQTYLQYKQKNITEQEVAEKKQNKIKPYLIMEIKIL